MSDSLNDFLVRKELSIGDKFSKEVCNSLYGLREYLLVIMKNRSEEDDREFYFEHIDGILAPFRTTKGTFTLNFNNKIMSYYATPEAPWGYPVDIKRILKTFCSSAEEAESFLMRDLTLD